MDGTERKCATNRAAQNQAAYNKGLPKTGVPPAPDASVAIGEDVRRLPLRAVWEKWLSERPAQTRDKDRLELFRAAGSLAVNGCDDRGLDREGKKRLCPVKLKELEYAEIIARLLPWLMRMTPVDDAADALLDLVERSYALVPERELRKVKDPNDWQDYTWRDYSSRNPDGKSWMKRRNMHPAEAVTKGHNYLPTPCWGESRRRS